MEFAQESVRNACSVSRNSHEAMKKLHPSLSFSLSRRPHSRQEGSFLTETRAHNLHHLIQAIRLYPDYFNPELVSVHGSSRTYKACLGPFTFASDILGYPIGCLTHEERLLWYNEINCFSEWSFCFEIDCMIIQTHKYDPSLVSSILQYVKRINPDCCIFPVAMSIVRRFVCLHSRDPVEFK